MAEAFNDNIEKLRKKSRALLARVDENSKKINAEVKKLHSQTLLSATYRNHKIQDNNIRKNTDLWKLRNDSSEINAVLRPDYFHFSPKHATTSVPNMMSSGKITLTSKKPREQCSKIVSRKPVKGCYCNVVNKVRLRSSKTQHKPTSPCRHCKSQLELVRETDDKIALTSPISCETFRRVQKIDYTPVSQFLRNVQNKIYELQIGGQGDCLQTCPRSSNYHKFMTSARMQDTISEDKTTLPEEHKHVDKRQKSPRMPANSLTSEESESYRDSVACTSSKGIQMSSRKLMKPTLRKTSKSKKQMTDSTDRFTSKSLVRSKRTTQLHKKDCSYGYKSDLEKETTKFSGDEHMEIYDLPEYYKQKEECLKHDHSSIVDDSVDEEVEDLRKFREQHYFDTHGSSHTLTSSRSSGSLQQYMLNERLFPEPVGRIHKQDLVVTMPPCATTQRKRIHYFPRYVVRQEKNIYNTNYRRKRYQNCPFTGHAIDLGVVKVRPPLNSLALKYQKTIP